jgi:outer membrane receptor protein involved in Fe transport
MFYNDWTDIVLRQLLDVDPESGYPLDAPTGFNVNAGDARVWGWETQVDIAFTDNLTGRATVGWNEAELTDARQDTYAAFPSFRAPGCENFPADPDMMRPNQHEVACLEAGGDVSGNQLLRQPEWTASASLTYERPLFGEWTWFGRADANYQDKVYVGNENQGWLPPHTYVNLRLGVESPRYSVELWGRNIFEDDNAIAAFRDVYIANTEDFYPPTEAFEAPGPRPSFDHFVPLRYTISYPKLRTYGLTVKVRFGGAER